MFDVDSLINTISPNKELISKPQSDPQPNNPNFAREILQAFVWWREEDGEEEEEEESATVEDTH